MPHVRLSIICVLLLTAAGVDSAMAQAWLRSAGSMYAKATFSYFFAREEFDFEGNEQPIFADQFSRTDAWFRDVSINTYFEYGVSESATLVAKLPFKVLTTAETENAGPGLPLRRITRSNGGPGDLTLLLRMPLVRRAFAAAVQFGGSIPLGYEKQPDNGGPPLGTGNLSGEIEVNAGRSFYPLPGYASGGLGYRRRQGRLHDEVFYNLEAGLTPGRFFFKLRFDGLQSTHAPPDLGSVSNNVIVGDQDAFKLSGESSYRVVGPVSVTVEFSSTLAGKNTTPGTAWAAGLVADL